MKIKKGDTVQVLTGKDRGCAARSSSPTPRTIGCSSRAPTGSRSTPSRQQTARGSQTGGIVETEAPIHVSNVGFVHPKTGKPGRLGYRIDDEGKKVRVCRSGGNEVDV